MMTPKEISKSGTEHAHQAAYFAYLNYLVLFGPDVSKIMVDSDLKSPPAFREANWVDGITALKYAHAIPNGGFRNAREAAKLKAEGVKSGVPDVFIPITMSRKSGLYIEFKEPGKLNTKSRGLSSSQNDFISFLQAQGYEVHVAFDWVEAANITLEYLELSQFKVENINSKP